MLHQTSVAVLNRFFYHQHRFAFTKPISRFPLPYSHATLPKVLSMATSHSNQHKFSNRLALEQSPYLLQYAHNPVDCIHGEKKLSPKHASRRTYLFINWVQHLSLVSCYGG
ncbi:unnamed protein product [Lathyrus sativus]|nr:unnamed protein product [Lathyrus sativus]